MKRFLAILLVLALVLTGCTHRQTTNRPANPPSADQVARAVLDVCSGMETEQITGDELQLWLTEFYRLPEDSWDDAAIYRAADPMSAFEIAVIRLSGKVNDIEVMYALEDYQLDREGDFTGYDPEQAKLVSDGLVCCSANVLFVALLICENPTAAANALSEAAARPAAPTPTPEATPVPTPAPTSTPEPTPEPTPTPKPATPISHPMEIYDTAPVRSAWESGDPSALNEYDRAIYDRCRVVLDGILKEGMTDYEKEHAIYLWIARHVSYDYDHYDKLGGASLDSSTPYNPLLHGKGICMGFATTFQLLSELAGLETLIVPGRAFHNREDHAWNMIRLNDKWYFVDVTWDKNMGNPKFWRYFNVTGVYMQSTDHQWDTSAFPQATATDGGVR